MWHKDCIAKAIFWKFCDYFSPYVVYPDVNLLSHFPASFFSFYSQFPVSSLLIYIDSLSSFSPRRFTPSSLLCYFFFPSELHPRSTGFPPTLPCLPISLYPSPYFLASGSEWMTQLSSFDNPKIIAPVHLIAELRVSAVIKMSFKHIFNSDKYSLI